jgi:sphingomyelin phosphodiesterase
VVQPVLPPPNTKTYRVVHLSDIHFDKDYTQGTEANCDEPLCCRPQSAPAKNNITAGYWGTSAKCDMPIWTLENLLEHLKTNETWDWMVWTGDMPPHDIWEQTKDDQISTLNTVYGLLYKYLSDEQIYLAVGNHESAPCDSFPPHHPDIPPEYDISWLYNQLAANWSNWISNVGDTQKDIKQIASYVTKVMPGLRLISLNTQYCDEGNFWLYANQTDPDGSLAWLIQQLQDAENSNDKVHIIGHVPSGDHTCLRFWSANYYDIINRYENTITGLFFGHTHSDQFAVFYEDGNLTNPTEVMYVAPSVTTFSWRMPTYRVYTIDSLSFEVLDHETYMLNLTEANLTNKTEWTLEYRASESYGLKSLFAEDWNNLIANFMENKTLFDTYYRHFDRNDKICNDSCQFDRLCEMRSGRSHDEQTLCADLPYYPNRTLEVSQSEPRSIFHIDIPPECLSPPSPPTTTAVRPASTTTEKDTKGGANSLKTHFHYEIINLFFLFIFAVFLHA